MSNSNEDVSRESSEGEGGEQSSEVEQEPEALTNPQIDAMDVRNEFAMMNDAEGPRRVRLRKRRKVGKGSTQCGSCLF